MPARLELLSALPDEAMVLSILDYPPPPFFFGLVFSFSPLAVHLRHPPARPPKKAGMTRRGQCGQLGSWYTARVASTRRRRCRRSRHLSASPTRQTPAARYLRIAESRFFFCFPPSVLGRILRPRRRVSCKRLLEVLHLDAVGGEHRHHSNA